MNTITPTQKKWTPDTLFTALQHIKLGGNICLYTIEQCEQLAPLINEINTIKQEKNAVILAHNYQTPEIYHGISDFSADSLALAIEAAKTKADIIIMCGLSLIHI